MAKLILGITLYTYKELCGMMDISDSALKSLFKKKKLTPIRIGRYSYVSESQIKKLLNNEVQLPIRPDYIERYSS